jgi:hypothetical protein
MVKVRGRLPHTVNTYLTSMNHAALSKAATKMLAQYIPEVIAHHSRHLPAQTHLALAVEEPIAALIPRPPVWATHLDAG